MVCEQKRSWKILPIIYFISTGLTIRFEVDGDILKVDGMIHFVHMVVNITVKSTFESDSEC